MPKQTIRLDGKIQLSERFDELLGDRFSFVGDLSVYIRLRASFNGRVVRQATLAIHGEASQICIHGQNWFSWGTNRPFFVVASKHIESANDVPPLSQEVAGRRREMVENSIMSKNFEMEPLAAAWFLRLDRSKPRGRRTAFIPEGVFDVISGSPPGFHDICKSKKAVHVSMHVTMEAGIKTFGLEAWVRSSNRSVKIVNIKQRYCGISIKVMCLQRRELIKKQKWNEWELRLFLWRFALRCSYGRWLPTASKNCLVILKTFTFILNLHPFRVEGAYQCSQP